MVEATLFTLIILLLTGAIWRQESYFVSPLSQQLLGLTQKKTHTHTHTHWLAVVLKHIIACYMDEVQRQTETVQTLKNTNRRI